MDEVIGVMRAVVEELKGGPKSESELIRATGYDREDISRGLDWLYGGGYVTSTVKLLDSGYEVDAYRLRVGLTADIAEADIRAEAALTEQHPNRHVREGDGEGSS